MSREVKDVTELTWKSEVLNSEIPVLVEFWAEWCGPCRMMAPVLEQLQKDYGNRLQIVKLNVDENASLATEYQIHSIPALKIFVGGSPLTTVIGAQPRHVLQEKIEKFI